MAGPARGRWCWRNRDLVSWALRGVRSSCRRPCVHTAQAFVAQGVEIVSFYIDPHIHMISRVTDDYHRMAQCGCVAVTEPAFWAGFDRGSAEGFHDYFRHLTEVEPKRAALFGIRHY